jgi:hypothetical protein
MVLVSHKYKFIYIKNIKVAGSSVESFFGQFCRNPQTKYDFSDKISQTMDEYGIIGSRLSGIRKHDIWKNHMDASSIKNEIGDDKFKNYFKFSVIRNPYDVMVSYYYWQKPVSSFKEYAKTTVVNNLERCSIDGASACDYYIRYEHLLDDIVHVCNRLNIENYDINALPKHKTNTRVKDIHYRDYYDEETRLHVYKNHKNILDFFGYEF